ncbi:hypothetical protein FIBSPDRAFT_947003 [Athelia psychrophila]|uniref:ATPase AAA-type core domain-containing protein n=1 Tax=Athelia psychrophila TaxID=1759441 RepID=A0A166SF34_9AGAM|nr:hypothetical protein FIBSPDRAFT_947003 [Fibularhizoctonia sp. CBS 109695]
MQRSSLPPTSSKHKRTISIIVLNPGVKEMLLNDTKDSEKVGMLIVAFPPGAATCPIVYGSSKFSLIHAIVGELMLDIYTLSLSSSWTSDGTLTTLMSRVPARGIVFLEDLDAAFTRSATRDSDSMGTPGADQNEPRDVTEPPEPRREPERHRRALGPAQRAGRRYRL